MLREFNHLNERVFGERRNDEFKGKLFFSHGQSNSCRVAIGFIGNTSFEVSNKKQDESGRITF